jgi:RNA polymerase sigma-70 factor, ECF subfamily
MGARVDAISGTAVTAADSPEREFAERLADSSSLAFRVAYSVLRNRADAEDVSQETFVRAYRSFHRLRDRERFRSWLVRIAWRLALDRRREAKRRERRETEFIRQAPGASVEDVAVSSEFRRRLEQALDELPEGLRIVVVLAAMEGHSVAEVAALLGASEGAVKSRLHRARRKLAEKLR